MLNLNSPADKQTVLDHREILNLGCGLKHFPDAINVDVTPDTQPDIVHDLNCHPWPFPDSRFREILLYDVIEHLEDIVKTVEEIYRICRPGGIVKITVPHFACPNAFTDPTHRHYFGWYSFDYFTGEHEHSYYTRVRFRTRTRKLLFYPSLLNKIVWRLANRYPAAYEQRWAWMFPGWFLFFELEAIKDSSKTASTTYEPMRSR